MFSSCSPTARLGRRGEDRLGQLRRPRAGPAGSATPCMVPSRWYSFQAEPGEVAAHDALDRQHLGRRHSMRPAARARRRARRSTRWRSGGWAPASASCSNQNADIAVSTRPLSGIGRRQDTSKAEIRSEVTMSSGRRRRRRCRGPCRRRGADRRVHRIAPGGYGSGARGWCGGTPPRRDARRDAVDRATCATCARRPVNASGSASSGVELGRPSRPSRSSAASRSSRSLPSAALLPHRQRDRDRVLLDHLVRRSRARRPARTAAISTLVVARNGR